MAYQPIDLGIRGNNLTGDDINIAGSKINSNFNELYTTKLDSIIQGSGISIDNTDPLNPIISSNITGYVDVLNNQVVGGVKSFSEYINLDKFIQIQPGGVGYGVGPTRGLFGYDNNGLFVFSAGTNHSGGSASHGRFKFWPLTTHRTYSFPDVTGEVAIIESNTFLPSLIDAGGGATYNVATNNSTYYKVGNMVNIYIKLGGITTSGAPSGEVRVGLPFQPAIIGQIIGPVSFHLGSNNFITTRLHAKTLNDLDNLLVFDDLASDTILQSITLNNGDISIFGTYISQ